MINYRLIVLGKSEMRSGIVFSL